MSERPMRGVTPLKQPLYGGKVHYYRADPSTITKWPVQVYCGDWIDEPEADRVTDHLSAVQPPERRCKRCMGRRLNGDKDKLYKLRELAQDAGEGGTVPVEEIMRIIELRATRVA